MEFSHIDEKGKAKMVDVSSKEITKRVAVAEGFIQIKPEVVRQIIGGNMPKGDVLSTAKIAGILAAKKTGDLIPMCHPIGLDHADIEFDVLENGIKITASMVVTAKTGIEMEALTAVSVAALTIYDMCKSADKSMTIDNVRLMKKSGGRSGEYIRSEK